MRPPVVILNMHYSGLGIARSLGRQGIPVHGVSAHPEFPGSASKYCRFRAAPDSLLDPIGLRDFLLEMAMEFAIRPILLPTRDHDIEFLVKHRDALSSRFVIPLADTDIIDFAMNKDRLPSLAQQCGIALPESATVTNRTELEKCAESFPFPAIVKPVYAKQWRRPGIWDVVEHQKAIQVDSAAELIELYRRIEPLDPAVIVQQYVPGPESSLVIFGSYCRPGGNVRAYFTARKRLQIPPLRGTGVIVEGLPIGQIVEPSRRLLATLGFSGISEIEYKIDEVTGVPYLIEINPRHWDQHHLGTVCGVNLTLEQYRDLEDPGRLMDQASSGAPPRQLRESVRWIAEQDLFMYGLAGVVRRDGRLRALLPMLRGRRTYSVLDSSDPRPGLRQLGLMVRQAFSSIVRFGRS